MALQDIRKAFVDAVTGDKKDTVISLYDAAVTAVGAEAASLRSENERLRQDLAGLQQAIGPLMSDNVALKQQIAALTQKTLIVYKRVLWEIIPGEEEIIYVPYCPACRIPLTILTGDRMKTCQKCKSRYCVDGDPSDMEV